MGNMSPVETLREIRANFAALQAELDAARARIAELEDIINWTLVKEKLPEVKDGEDFTDRVIITFLLGQSLYSTIAKYLPVDTNFENWSHFQPERMFRAGWYEDGNIDPLEAEVICWQPLPVYRGLTQPAAPEVDNA